MTRAKLPGIIDIEPTRSRKSENKGKVYVVYRNEGNREVLSTSELLSSKRKAYQNIVASCKLHGGGFVWRSPMIRDRTVKPERFIWLDFEGPQYQVIEV